MPLPSTGSSRVEFPRFSGTMGGLRRLVSSPRFVAVALAVPPARRFSSLPGRIGATLVGPGLFLLRRPRAATSSDGEYETSQVPGEPLRTCHALRPRRTAHPLPIRGARCCLPLRKRRRLRNHFLSRLNHVACTLPVYASTVASRPHDATLGSGWWLAFPGTGLSPAGFR